MLSSTKKVNVPLALIVVLTASFVTPTHSAAWDYKNLTAWNIQTPRCADQSHQSPRVLNANTATAAGNCHDLSWSNNHSRTFTVSNNGHSLTFTPTLSSGETTANTFIWGGYSWCLAQFHMHWSQNNHGAEHRLENYDNGLEVHFVHRRCDYPNLTAAVAEDTNAVNTVAVIGVLYQVGPDMLMRDLINTTVITNDLLFGNATSQVVNFPYTQMLPPVWSRKFYNYQGSLTTPTCDPVAWFVMESQQNVSAAEMALLRQVRDSSGVVILHNQRPLQQNNQTLVVYEPCTSGGWRRCGHGIIVNTLAIALVMVLVTSTTTQ